MENFIIVMSDPIISIGLLCILLVLLIAFVVTILLMQKKSEAIKDNLRQEIAALRLSDSGKEVVLKSLLNTGNALYDLSEQSELDALSRLSKLHTILLEQFPWGKNLDQKIILTKIFSGVNKEEITSEDVYTIRLIQDKIESFRRRLSIYSYPLEDKQILELRAQYFQLSMLALDVLDSLAEHPNYFADQQGMNVNILLNHDNDNSPHKVTTLEDSQEKWALIMKGILDGIEKDETVPLIFCGYKF